MLTSVSYILLFWSVTLAMLSNHDLIQACKSGDVPTTRRLLESIDPGAHNCKAFIEASARGHSSVVELLLADPRIEPNVCGNQAIFEASRRGHLMVVKLLLGDPRIDPGGRNNEAIRWASSKGHTDIVKLLLADPRVDPGACNNEAICWASSNGHDMVVGLLLADPRVDPSGRNNEAINLASYLGHIKVIELLLADPRVDPGARQNRAIRDASLMGRNQAVKLLMAHPKVLPSLEIVQRTFESSNLTLEFFQAATNPAGLDELLPLANLINGLTLDLLDILISRAKGIQLNQEFLHSLRLLKLPIPVEIKVAYDKHLQALFSVLSSSDVLKLAKMAVYFAEMGIHAELFRLFVQNHPCESAIPGVQEHLERLRAGPKSIGQVSQEKHSYRSVSLEQWVGKIFEVALQDEDELVVSGLLDNWNLSGEHYYKALLLMAKLPNKQLQIEYLAGDKDILRYHESPSMGLFRNENVGRVADMAAKAGYDKDLVLMMAGTKYRKGKKVPIKDAMKMACTYGRATLLRFLSAHHVPPQRTCISDAIMSYFDCAGSPLELLKDLLNLATNELKDAGKIVQVLIEKGSIFLQNVPPCPLMLTLNTVLERVLRNNDRASRSAMVRLGLELYHAAPDKRLFQDSVKMMNVINAIVFLSLCKESLPIDLRRLILEHVYSAEFE